MSGKYRFEIDRNLSILCVEDDESVLREYRTLMQKFFDISYFAKDGQEALQIYLQKRPDIVLTDISMPIMDGLELSSKIKDIDSGAYIIIATAFSNSEYLLKSVTLGISDYILKPINIKSLGKTLEKISKSISQKRLEQDREYDLKKREELFRTLTESSSVGIFLIKNFKFKYVNPEFSEITGYSDYELINLEPTSLFENPTKFRNCINEHLKNPELQNYLEGKILSKDGVLKWLYMGLKSIKVDSEISVLITVIDISNMKSIQNELERLASVDRLTDTLNRHKFSEILPYEIDRAKRYKEALSILMIDLDNFKLVNDKFGHLMGDYVLKEIANLIKSNTRSVDYLFRFGGEEFIILAPNTDIDGAKILAKHIQEAIESFKFNKVKRVTVSIGVTALGDKDSETTFIARADKALYQAKSSGKNRFVTKE